MVDTVMKSMPLGIMYWMKKLDGSFELMDGQQRTQLVLDTIKLQGTTKKRDWSTSRAFFYCFYYSISQQPM